jgi:thioredoxin-like negative regulator of GroEL
MVERLALLVALGLAIALVVVLVRWRARTLSRRVQRTPAGELWRALNLEPDGRPTVVAFSAPACGECQVQATELARLDSQRCRLLEVDAARQPEVAQAFGILSAPSTVILDDRGSVSHVNRSLVPASSLRQQLGEAASATPAGAAGDAQG